jgi:hypothetical protein
MNFSHGGDKVGRTVLAVAVLVLIGPALLQSQSSEPKKAQSAPAKSTAPAPTKQAAPGRAGTAPPSTVNRPPQPGVKPPSPANPAGSSPSAVNKPAPGAPGTKREPLPGGGTSVTQADGRHWEVGKTGQVTHFSRPGMEAKFGENGRMSSAHLVRADRSEITVSRSVRGDRRIEVMRPDHSRLVSVGPNRGYLERPLSTRPGFVERTYVVGGRAEVRVYRTFAYRGVVYYRYVPAVYYQPAFYAWAYNPWAAPVAYGWGWGGARWYAFYGGYFEPAPVYPTAALWLTDYLLAENLKVAYENQQAANNSAAAPPASAPPAPAQSDQSTNVALTPEVKQMIAEEVKQQLAAEQAVSGQQASPQPPPGGAVDEAPPALDPKQRVFVVSSTLDVAASGNACALTAGDIILRTEDTPGDGNTVGVSVLNSKAGDCPVNSSARMEVAALQEMHNQFREHIASGLTALADNQGKSGLPAGPAPGSRPAKEGQAAPDLNVDKALLAQQQDANQLEAEARQAAVQGVAN